MTSQPVSAPAAPPAEIPAPSNPVIETAVGLVTANGPSRRPSRLPKARRLSRRSKILIGLGLGLFVVVILYLVYYFITRPRDVRADLVTHKVQFGRLELTIVERGALESANNHDIVCRVKAKNQQSQTSTTIKWIIDDGSQVKHDRPKEEAQSIIFWDPKNISWLEKPASPNGTMRVVEQKDEQSGLTVYSDLLVELDDSGLIEQLKDQMIVRDKAEADKIAAEETYNIQLSQNESDIQTKRTAFELAQIDLEKYQKGDFPQKLKDVDGRIKVAESDLEQQRDRSAWAQRMLKKGYYTVSQADSEQSKLQSLQLALAKVEEEKRVLVDPNYGDKKRTETDFKNKVLLAKDDLDRAVKQAHAKEVQVRTDRDTKKSIYDQGVTKYNDIVNEIKKCRLAAPQDGLAVYYVAEQTRWGIGRQALVAQGEQVAENQKLMQIPDLKHMFVNAKIHEAMVGKVHKGQKAMVRVDAMHNSRLKARVESVANTPAQQDFFAADVKVYPTKVYIDEEVEGLKPGMTSEVTITIADALEHVLTVPIQAIVGSSEMGETRKCFVMTPAGPVAREVVVGMENGREAEIKSGLSDGDEVVTNPKLLVGDKVKTREPGELVRKDANGGDTPDKGGKGGPRGPGGAPGMAPGAGRGGPGLQKGGPGGPENGGGRSPEGRGKGGAQKGGFQQPTPEQMKEIRKKTVDTYKPLTPEKRKEQLQNVPEQWRDNVRKMLKEEKIEVPD